MIIAVDFDGTLCDESNFPEIGKPRIEIINWVKAQKASGHKLILWTCREGEFILNAVKWCHEKGLNFDAINENIAECRFGLFGHHKVVADIYLDDKAMKCGEINIKPEDFKRGL